VPTDPQQLPAPKKHFLLLQAETLKHWQIRPPPRPPPPRHSRLICNLRKREDRKNQTRRKRENRRRADLKRGRKNRNFACVFLLLQVMVVVTADRERKRRKTLQAPLFFQVFQRRRVNPRAASSGGSWKDAPPLFPPLEILLNTIPACRRCSL
jgi:hypothetical protein